MRVNSSNLHFRKDYSGLLCSEKNGDMSDQKPRKWAETVRTHAGELRDAVRPEAGVEAPAGRWAWGRLRCRLPRDRTVRTVSRFSPAKAPLPPPPHSLQGWRHLLGGEPEVAWDADCLGTGWCGLPRDRMVRTVSRFSPAKAPLPPPPRSLLCARCWEH